MVVVAHTTLQITVGIVGFIGMFVLAYFFGMMLGDLAGMLIMGGTLLAMIVVITISFVFENKHKNARRDSYEQQKKLEWLKKAKPKKSKKKPLRPDYLPPKS